MILGESMPTSVSRPPAATTHLKANHHPRHPHGPVRFRACPVTWRHRLWGAEEYTPEVSNGIFFYGEKETVFVTDDRWVEIPKGKNQQRVTHEAKADLGGLHMAEFLDAVRTRKQPSGTVEQAFQSTATVKLGMIAYDCGQSIRWKPPPTRSKTIPPPRLCSNANIENPTFTRLPDNSRGRPNA